MELGLPADSVKGSELLSADEHQPSRVSHAINSPATIKISSTMLYGAQDTEVNNVIAKQFSTPSKVPDNRKR